MDRVTKPAGAAGSRPEFSSRGSDIGRSFGNSRRTVRRSGAALAALAIEHGATLCTTDRDFARFPALTWTNPIASR